MFALLADFSRYNSDPHTFFSDMSFKGIICYSYFLAINNFLANADFNFFAAIMNYGGNQRNENESIENCFFFLFANAKIC